jgi:hypothetical protein
MPYPDEFKFGSRTWHPPQEIKTAGEECVYAERNVQYAEKRLLAILELIEPSGRRAKNLPAHHRRQLGELKRGLRMLGKIQRDLIEVTWILDHLSEPGHV